MKLPPGLSQKERSACSKYMRAHRKWAKAQPPFMDAIDSFEKAVGKTRARVIWKALGT